MTNAFSASVVTCLHNLTSNIWRDIICYHNGITTSHGINFGELTAKTEMSFVVLCRYIIKTLLLE